MKTDQNQKLSKSTNLTSLKSLAKMITNQTQHQTSKSNLNQNPDQDTTDSRIRTRSVITVIIQIMMNPSATIRTESANQRSGKRFTNLSLNILERRIKQKHSSLIQILVQNSLNCLQTKMLISVQKHSHSLLMMMMTTEISRTSTDI